MKSPLGGLNSKGKTCSDPFSICNERTRHKHGRPNRKSDKTRLISVVRGHFPDTFTGFVGKRTNHKTGDIHTIKIRDFPMKTPVFRRGERDHLFHGTEAAITMVRDTSPADVNLEEEDPQARKLTQSRQR